MPQKSKTSVLYRGAIKWNTLDVKSNGELDYSKPTRRVYKLKLLRCLFFMLKFEIITLSNSNVTKKKNFPYVISKG